MNALLDLAKIFLKDHPQQSLAILRQVDFDTLLEFMNTLDIETLSFIFPFLDRTTASLLSARMEKSVVEILFQTLSPEIIAQILRGKPHMYELLNALEEKDKITVSSLLKHENDTIGAFIDSFPLCVREHESLQNVFEDFQSSRQKAIYYIYIVNAQGGLVGVTTIKELCLFLKNPSLKISEIMKTHITVLKSHADKTTLFDHLGWKSFHALPVVDENFRYLGAIRHKIIIKIKDSLNERSEQNDLQETSKALGNLFFMGLFSVFKGASSLLEKHEDHDDKG